MYVKITTITEQNLNPRMWVRFVVLDDVEILIITLVR